MTALDTARLTMQAVNMIHRADLVATDPAVVKAAKTAAKDISRACRSTAALTREVGAAWCRYQPDANQSVAH